jgi:hypothetical protein
LTREEIDLYVRRAASADEIISFAEHLEQCVECRDRTSAFVDDGSDDLPHTTPPSLVPDVDQKARGVVIWVGILIAAILGVAMLLIVMHR